MSHDVPDPIRRQLRQEARFGCCACGFPVFQYHHIIPLEAEVHDRPADMMVLCPNHHDMVTNGAIAERHQREWKAAPFNVTRGYADGLLLVGQDYCAVECGTCLFVNDGVVVMIDDEPLLELGIEDGRVLLSVTLYDEDDNLLALIEKNEWVSGDPTVWDLEASFQRLAIRRRARDVSIRLGMHAQPMTLRARLWRHGYLVDIAPNAIRVGSRKGHLEGESGVAELIGAGMVGLRLAVRTDGVLLSIEPDPRYGGGIMVAEQDPLRRLAECINKLNRLRAGIPTDKA